MAKGFGVAGLVVALLAFPVPIVTLYIVWLALLLATAAGLLGDKVFPIATALASLINLVFFSPITWAILWGESLQGGSGNKVLTFVLLIAPIIALVVGAIWTRPAATAENKTES